MIVKNKLALCSVFICFFIIFFTKAHSSDDSDFYEEIEAYFPQLNNNERISDDKKKYINKAFFNKLENVFLLNAKKNILDHSNKVNLSNFLKNSTLDKTTMMNLLFDKKVHNVSISFGILCHFYGFLSEIEHNLDPDKNSFVSFLNYLLILNDNDINLVSFSSLKNKIISLLPLISSLYSDFQTHYEDWHPVFTYNEFLEPDNSSLLLAIALRKVKNNKDEDLTEENFQTILDAIKRNEIHHLDLQEKNIDVDMATRIGEALQHNESVVSLDLYYSNIKDESVKAILSKLNLNSTLTHIDLSYNQIDDAGAAFIGSFLKNNKCITSLNLEHNFFKNLGTMKIANGLIANKTLKKISLADNNISDKGLMSLKMALHNNETLNLINLSGLNVSEKSRLNFNELKTVNPNIDIVFE
ncbi:MAG: hypothetical protein Q8L85_00060 [Alphaproteobacteria bacterium]|nr:hypothetical protein [Alphaproteobacteria bacterium]